MPRGFAGHPSPVLRAALEQVPVVHHSGALLRVARTQDDMLEQLVDLAAKAALLGDPLLVPLAAGPFALQPALHPLVIGRAIVLPVLEVDCVDRPLFPPGSFCTCGKPRLQIR